MRPQNNTGKALATVRCSNGLRAFAVLSLLALSGCDSLPEWITGGADEIKRAPGERVNIVAAEDALKADASAADVAIEVPDQTNLEQWLTANDAMQANPHVGLTGVTRHQSARIGGGEEFVRNVVSPPVVAGSMVYAMDAAGVISAHSEADISDIKWTSKTERPKGVKDVLGGGLAVVDGVLYATNGSGNLSARDVTNGQVKWNINVGAPVRGAPAVAAGMVVVLTADNQTLAFDASNGQPRWEHRGIRETTGYYSITSPVISEGIVVAAYSSGEVFALRLETGSALWSDSFTSAVRTKASAAVSGIDANPIVQDGVVVVASASGQIQASALLNGRPLWQQKVGAHTTPWSAGNAIYVLTDTHDIAALLKRDGSVRWATSLAVKDKKDATHDITPPLYGPILSANAILVVDGKGVLKSYKPTDGSFIGQFELEEGVVSNPVVANGAMYLITKDAELVKYY